jgi:methylglyoxal synthase
VTSRRLLLMNTRKRIALIAHDNRKHDLLDWVRCNRGILMHHDLFATGTTGSMLSAELGLDITRFASGPLGGDQQVGAGIVEGRIDFVIFFSDPLEPHPHDVDVKSLLRIAVLYNIPVACNRATADFIVSSPLLKEEYRRLTMGIEDQLVRWVQPVAAERPQSELLPTELLLQESRPIS